MNLTPPASAKSNAKRALEWRKKYPKETKGAGTATGWTRARQLSQGGELTPDTVRRMASFNRHNKNAAVDPKYKSEPWRDKGYLMWLAWGGTSGVNWAIRKSEQLKKESKDAIMAQFDAGQLLDKNGDVVSSRKKAEEMADEHDINLAY